MFKTMIFAGALALTAISTTASASQCSMQNDARRACTSRCNLDQDSGSFAQRVRAGQANDRCRASCPLPCDNDGTPYGARRNAR